MVSATEIFKLTDIFEDTEEKLFGKNGYESIIKQLIKIELSLKINAFLERYSPQISDLMP